MMHPIRKRVFLVIVLACLIGYLAFFAVYFVSLERQFYVWDFGGYQRMAVDQIGNFLSSPISSVKFALASLDEDYNYLFTLPMLPLMYLLGNPHSRSTYILSLSLVYLVPYILALGLVARKLVVAQSGFAFWAAVVVGVFSSAAWLPTLRGYPDTGAAFLLLIAAWAYLSDRELKKWWQVMLIGACLAIATLFRRHFAYAAIAFLVSIILVTLIEYVSQWKENPHRSGERLIRTGLRIGMILVVCLLVLLAIGLPFLKLVLSTNYQSLYSAWTSPPLQVFMVYQAYYGWGLIFLAMAGLVAGFFSRGADRGAVGFAIVYGLVSILQWLTIVRQINPHYTLHFTWMLMLGSALAIWWLWTRLKGGWRIVGLAAVGAYFALNMVFWLAPGAMAAGEQAKPLFTRMTEPLVRPDYDSVAKMVSTLHKIIPQNARLYVVDSSGIINYDLFLSAGNELFPGQPFNVLLSPQVDSRDFYPIESFLQADFVVVSNPLQIHLGKADQGVVSGVYDVLTQNWEAAQAFKRLPDQFPLMWGVKTSIFERVRDTLPGEAIRLLSKLQQVVGPRPGAQPDWVLLDHSPQGGISRIGNAYKLNASLPASVAHYTLSWLYLGEMPARAAIKGTVSVRPKTCPPANLALSLAYGDGAIKTIEEHEFKPGKAKNLAYEFDTEGAAYLLLAVSGSGTGQGDQACRLVIDDLKVGSAE